MARNRLSDKTGDHGTSGPAGNISAGGKGKNPSTDTFNVHCNRALVVDDQPVMVQLVSLMLESLGFRVDSAGGGREAKRLLDDGNIYDLVVTGLNMPHIDGLSLAGWVKHYAKKTRVVIMSGSLTYADLCRGSTKGLVDNWISKPFDSQELKSVLRELRIAWFPAGRGGRDM